jgi:hypothetical protein
MTSNLVNYLFTPFRYYKISLIPGQTFRKEAEMNPDFCIFCGEETNYRQDYRNKIPILCTNCSSCSRHYCIKEEEFNRLKFPIKIKVDPSQYEAYKEFCESFPPPEMPVFGIDIGLS